MTPTDVRRAAWREALEIAPFAAQLAAPDSGRLFAGTQGTMGARKTLDRQPGPLPDIRADGDNVTFGLGIPGLLDGSRLVLRCDAAGEVWARIVPAAPAPYPYTAGE
jgi:hypothetical protein